jgi:hypothetical protein
MLDERPASGGTDGAADGDESAPEGAKGEAPVRDKKKQAAVEDAKDEDAGFDDVAL